MFVIFSRDPYYEPTTVVHDINKRHHVGIVIVNYVNIGDYTLELHQYDFFTDISIAKC